MRAALATAIRLWAERRVGELLREMEKAKGARGVGKKVGSTANDSTLKLTALGISRNQSSAWQRLAAPNVRGAFPLTFPVWFLAVCW